MKYKFKIDTINGVIEHEIESEVDFNCAPFGFVPYRSICTCECNQTTINAFWDIIDVVLQAKNLSTDKFVRAVCAVDENGVIYGEHQ